MRRSTCILFVVLSFGATLMSQTTSIDDLFKDFTGNVPGAVVMVIHHGKVESAKAYGLADLRKRTPCSLHTNFRLASLTKQFTAMAILMLAERKQLSIDDPITKYFPEFPDYGKTITIKHLLSHRSGLIDYEDVIPKGTTIPVIDRNVLLLLRQQNKTYFSPGSQFRYSNSGYALLSLIVEKASGIPFAEYLRKNIFQPLGMVNTLAYEAGLLEVPNRAFGYALEDGNFKDSDQSLTSSVLGDGGIYSSAEDLFRWDQALYTEKLLSRSTMQMAFTPHSETTDMPDSGYGFGWYISKFKGTDYVWHYGETCGFTTRIDRFPEKQFTVIVLTNRRDAKISEIGKTIFSEPLK